MKHCTMDGPTRGREPRELKKTGRGVKGERKCTCLTDMSNFEHIFVKNQVSNIRSLFVVQVTFIGSYHYQY